MIRASLLLRLIKARGVPSSTSSSTSFSPSSPSIYIFKNCHTWNVNNAGNVNILLLPNFGFNQFNQYKNFSSKQESYFSAIGGESDEPPPELTPEEVTTILRINEIKLTNPVGPIDTIECNQLAANSPTEDRLRIARLRVNNSSSSSNPPKETILFAVFDGHGGRLCADVVTNRLFKYIALTMSSDPVHDAKKVNMENCVHDLHICPNITQSIDLSYGRLAADKIKKTVAEKDSYYLANYAKKLQDKPLKTIEQKLTDAFLQCDQDLSDEIEIGLLNPTSNVLVHYYLSLAVSGCCVTLIMIHGDDCYIASTGDCKAALGFRESGPSQHPVTKSLDLTREHNSDNAAETKRLLSAHPPNERTTIIRNDRLLSHLMPFRAFGDFCYKWEIDKIKRVGLTRAFGSHIIPPHYLTPPYLIAEPEVSKISLSSKTSSTIGNRYIVIATDGLWEQFASSRCVIKQLFRHQIKLSSLDSSDPSSNVTNVPKSIPLDKKSTEEETENKRQAQGNCADDENKEEPMNEGKEPENYVDPNSSTHLIRVALGTPPMTNVTEFEEFQQHDKLEHKRLVTFLTLPSHLVRNFRDDITVIVLKLH